MKAFNLLLIEDDPLVAESLSLVLPEHWQVDWSRQPRWPKNKVFHAAVVDLYLEGETEPSGLQTIKSLREYDENLAILVLSGEPTLEIMQKCLDLGADRFLPKPLATDELLLRLEQVESLWALKVDTPWVGQGRVSKSIMKQIADLKGVLGPILIEGESGVGKELVAQLLHRQSAQTTFVAVNMASVPEPLFESELFGFVKGAFTGAHQMRRGHVDIAERGTLFLDEIEALPLPSQAKLLRLLETREYQKLGSSEPLQAQCQFIVASNRDLKQMVQEGLFRQDLYYRLLSHQVHIPPLRERTDEIEDYIQYFISSSGRVQRQLEPAAIERLKAFSWPGNLRELKGFCEKLTKAAPLPIIREQDVAELMRENVQPDAEPAMDLTPGLFVLVSQFEKRLIEACLREAKDIDVAAQRLKISRSSLYKKIKDLSISWRKT